jgi:hypothetical protein
MLFAAWLREQRQSRGWDIPEMARRLAIAAGEARRELPSDECLRQYIRRWERRAVGLSERYRLLYARSFGMEPGQVERAWQAGEVPEGDGPGPGTAGDTGHAPGPPPVTDLGHALGQQSLADLMMGRHDNRAEAAGIVAGEHLLRTVEQVGLGLPAEPGGRAGRPARVDHRHVAQIETATGVFRQWDNEFGGGLRRKAVVGQLNEVSALLAGPFGSGQVARRLLSAVADLAQLAGWMSYDLHMQATAQRYCLLGMHVARDAGDRPQVARLVYCLAPQMIELGRYADALDLAEAGLYVLRRQALPKPAAMLHIIVARAHAGMASPRECHRALGTAQEVFGHGGTGADPAWCAFFDEGELCGLVGVALRDLALCDPGRAAEHAAVARPWIERAITGRPDGYLRSKVMDTDGLAVTMVLLGEHDEAVSRIAAALPAARGVASSRLADRLARTVGLARQRFPGSPEVAGLGEQVMALSATV